MTDLIDHVVLIPMTYSQDQLQAMRYSAGVNEVRCKTAALNNTQQIGISECVPAQQT